MDYLRKLHMVCFEEQEFKNIFCNTYIRRLHALRRADPVLSPDQLADELISQAIKSKEEVEFFIAADTCFNIYLSENKKICFKLRRGIQPKHINVNSLDDLKTILEEDDLTDFAIWSDGLRQFQLKQYKQELKTHSLFEFIKKKLEGYCNDLGETNLLVVLQGPRGESMPKSEINFKEIHRLISELKITSNSQILLQFNENNNFSVLNQVYPELKSIRQKLTLPSSSWS